MNYSETLDYLYTRLPMFQRIGAAAYKADLNNTIAICSALGNPEKGLKCIHIAGTNGKGSVSHMLASILQEQGYKTGLYTSPHLIDFRERIKINGEMISESYIIGFVERYKKEFEKIEPSFFEWTVGLAFDYFRNEGVDIAVIETGLGGRLDSTNVIDPLVSVITNISFDHQALLGDTLEKIAIEKAGIIKKGIPVVIGETEEQTKNVFLKRAEDLSADILFADQKYQASHIGLRVDGRVWRMRSDKRERNVLCQLLGLYQGKNLQTVFAAIDVINDKLKIDDHSLMHGVARVIDNTGLSGRWQLLQENPSVLCDTGHNEAGIKEVLINLKEESYNRLHWVLGMVNDKDLKKVLELLPKNAVYYFSKASVPRALDEDNLKQQAEESGLNGNAYKTVEEALESALSNAGVNDLIFIGGSTFTVADALVYWRNREVQPRFS